MNIIAKSPILYEKKRYGAGDTLEVKDSYGERLIKLGYATAVADKSNTATATVVSTSTPTPEDKKEEAVNTPLPGEDGATAKSYDTMTRDEIAQELSMRGIGFKPSASRDKLLAELKEASV